MEILFVTPTIPPAVSGPALVSGALPKALRGLGHRVTLLSPLYRSIDPVQRNLARRLMKLEVEVAGTTYACELYDGRSSAGVDLVFLGHEELFRTTDRLGENGGDPALEARRLALFAHAAAKLLVVREPRFDLVHAHDAAGGAALTVARTVLGNHTPSVLTIHDIASQGVLETEHAAAFGFSPSVLEKAAIDGNRIALLKAGIEAADRVATLSPGIAAEIVTPEGGYGLEGVLSALGERLVGLPSGIDVSMWNPVTDSHLPFRFDPVDPTGKLLSKSSFTRELGLPVIPELPMIGAFGTTHPDEGMDLFVKALPGILRNDVQVVLQLDGDRELIQVAEEIAERWPERFCLRVGSEEKFRHPLIGASDFLMVPARRTSAGYLPMIAHRYGTMPIVRRASALADRVVDCDAALKTGNGFVFDAPTSEELLAAVQRALAAFTQGEAFDALRRRTMRLDHSWERSARLHERMYRELVEPTTES